jgi:hypothetical protein
MSLKAGYNIVSEPIDSGLPAVSAVEFFRRLHHGADVPGWVTVRGLEDVLAHTAEQERDATLSYLNRLLGRATSGELIGVQFLVNGSVQKDTHVYITPNGSDTRLYIDELFREQPTRLSSTHFHSGRA